MPVQVTLAAPKTNFKSVYTKEDYSYWDAYSYVTYGNEDIFSEGNCGYHTGSGVKAEHSCTSCPTVSQMVAYLKAGVYWDNNVAGEGQQTYSAPDSASSYLKTRTNLHTGLWIKKKKSVTGATFYSETATSFSTKKTQVHTQY